MSFKILCLDGGGARGIISARILQEVEKVVQQQVGKPLHEYFDMISGTSTGSIIAAGLATGMSASQLVKLYQEDGMKIFPYTSYYSPKRLSHVFKYKASLIASALQGIEKQKNKSALPRTIKWQQLLGLFKTCPKFSHDGLTTVLKQRLGDRKIKDIQHPRLLIFAYDTLYRNTTFFNSHHPEANRWFDEFELWQICASSASAPTFFPPYEFRWKDADGDEWSFPHVDGGVSSNNPSMASLVHAMSVENKKLEDISILSISTGQTTAPFEYQQVKSWGLIDWAEQIPNVFMGGQLQITSDLCREIMLTANSKSYVRLGFELNKRLGSRKTPNSPREILSNEEAVNEYTNKHVSEAIDDASPSNLQDLLSTTEAFLNSSGIYLEREGKPFTVKEAINYFVKNNS